MLYYVRKPRRLPVLTPALKLLFRANALNEVRQEVRIWDHKIHRPRPVLLPHEKGIKALRRWYAQFYPPHPSTEEPATRDIAPDRQTSPSTPTSS